MRQRGGFGAATCGLAILAAGALAACSGQRLDEDVSVKRDAIVNGNSVTSANPPQNPGTVAVYHQFVRPCSGTLLRMQWVLTAKHCLVFDPDNWQNSPLRPASDIKVVRAISPGLQP